MIVEKNIQIQKMEEEMENLIKEREIRLNTGVETSTIATSIARISTKIVSASKT